jgi:ABC-type glutathione transport system ATPase component
MLIASDLVKAYVKRSLLGKPKRIPAVNGVSLEIRQGETVGLVGESGCGKSTLGRCLAVLERFQQGRLSIGGRDVCSGGLSGRERRELRKEIQLILQNPVDSLNPRLCMEQLVAEPLVHFGWGSKRERQEKARYYVEKVGLSAEHMGRYPGELSRGQCQRVNIARALLLEPRVLICDEIVSALDVVTGTKILRLLVELQQENGFGCLFISHDLARVTQISRRIAVMHQGRIVEERAGRDFHLRAEHPYSRSLLAAVPRIGWKTSSGHKL